MNAVQKKVLDLCLAYEKSNDALCIKTMARNGWKDVMMYGGVSLAACRNGKWTKAAHDFSPQPLDRCYFCGGKVTDYANEYVADTGDHGVWVYAAKCGVCEECAREKARGATFVRYPHITRKYERMDGGRTVQVHEYSDGGVTEGALSDIGALFQTDRKSGI